MRSSNIFTNASRIQLRDGTVLKEDNPRVLRSIVHQQLHTHLNRFELRKQTKPTKVVRKSKATRPPVDFKKAMRATKGTIEYH